jgi:hypothetical protein
MRLLERKPRVAHALLGMPCRQGLLQGPEVEQRRRQVTRALHKTFDDPTASLGPARAVSYDGSFHGAQASAMVVGGQPPPLGNMLGGDLPPKEQRKLANMARMRRFGLKQMIE